MVLPSEIREKSEDQGELPNGLERPLLSEEESVADDSSLRLPSKEKAGEEGVLHPQKHKAAEIGGKDKNLAGLLVQDKGFGEKQTPEDVPSSLRKREQQLPKVQKSPRPAPNEKGVQRNQAARGKEKEAASLCEEMLSGKGKGFFREMAMKAKFRIGARISGRGKIAAEAVEKQGANLETLDR